LEEVLERIMLLARKFWIQEYPIILHNKSLRGPA